MAMIEVHLFIFFMKKTVARWRYRQKQITECPCKKFTAGLKIGFLISKQRNRAGRIPFATIFRFTIFSFATLQILQKCLIGACTRRSSSCRILRILKVKFDSFCGSQGSTISVMIFHSEIYSVWLFERHTSLSKP